MGDSWLERNREAILGILRLVVIGAGAITATFGGTEVVTGRVADDLARAEAVAAVGNARAEKFGVYDTFADFATAVEVRKAGCDAALEAFARHRNDDRDFAHALEECHSEGAIE